MAVNNHQRQGADRMVMDGQCADGHRGIRLDTAPRRLGREIAQADYPVDDVGIAREAQRNQRPHALKEFRLLFLDRLDIRVGSDTGTYRNNQKRLFRRLQLSGDEEAEAIGRQMAAALPGQVEESRELTEGVLKDP